MTSKPVDHITITIDRAENIASTIEGLMDGAIADLKAKPGLRPQDLVASAFADMVRRAQDIAAARLHKLGAAPDHARYEIGRIAAFYAGQAISEVNPLGRQLIAPILIQSLLEGTKSPCPCEECVARRSRGRTAR